MSVQPGTPLPWQQHGSHIYGPDPDKPLIGQFLSDNGRLLPDISYALVACNSFPELVAALEGLADVLEHDCECPPCIGSMAPGEHYLGLARKALSALEVGGGNRG